MREMEDLVEIKKEVRSQFAKWFVGAVVVSLSFAAAGWWFYLEKTWIEIAGGVPVGTVAAFDRPEGCPKGWEKFDNEAGGRVIVGVGSSAGTTSRVYRESGGKETHILSVTEIPAHTHGGNVSIGSGHSYEHHKYGDGRLPGETWQASTQPAGGGAPHPTMPPFLALHLCKRGPYGSSH